MSQRDDHWSILKEKQSRSTQFALKHEMSVLTKCKTSDCDPIQTVGVDRGPFVINIAIIKSYNDSYSITKTSPCNEDPLHFTFI